jgi:hypothetical protein
MEREPWGVEREPWSVNRGAWGKLRSSMLTHYVQYSVPSAQY